MTAKDVYERSDVPRNLQLHMLRVAGLVQELRAHWVGQRIDWQTVTRAALLHDIANVIKFDLDKFPQLLGEQELRRVDYWRAKQKELVEKYGDDEHAAGEAMLAELGVPEAVRDVINQKSFGNAKTVNASPALPAKILLYCDLRILPHGLGSLQARLADVRERLTKYSSRADFPELVAAAENIEQTIQVNVSYRLETFISERAIDSHLEELLNRPIA